MFVLKQFSSHRFNCFQQSKCLYSSSIVDLVKPITVNTGQQLYPILKKKNAKLYKHYTYGGLDISVDYLDTKKVGKHYDKVILAVHGSVANLNSYELLVEKFRDSTVRVVIPNLPKFSHTRANKIFWHSSIENAQFIRDLLYKLDINTIDCLISHSFGFQSCNLLWDKSFELDIKSVLLLSPETWLTVDESQFNKGKLLLLFTSNWWYTLVEILRLYRLEKFFPIKVENVDDLFLLAAYSFDTDAFQYSVDRVKTLVDQDILTAVVFGTRESIIPKKAIPMINKVLQIPQNNVINYDQAKDNLENFKLTNRRNSLMVQGGGHFIHKKFPTLFLKLIDNLLYFQKITR